MNGDWINAETKVHHYGADRKELVELSLDLDRDGMADAVFVATDGHPIWSLSRDTWVDAGGLRAGDEVVNRRGRGQELLSIRALKSVEETVYNLTVDV